MDGNFDLLGDPIPEGWGKRGRPPHRVTAENRCKVMLLLAINRRQDQIAAALGISEPTLRRNYFRELKTKEDARFRVEGTRMLRLYQEVESGNVAAIKELGKALEKGDLLAAHLTAHASGGAKKGSKEPKLGKKEMAIAAARTPDTETTIGDLMSRRQGNIDKLN